MADISQLKLTDTEKNAIRELKSQLLEKFPDFEIILFGSKTRGDDREFSDIDILLLTAVEINGPLNEQVIEISYDIELKYDVIFSIIIENKKFWDSPLARAMPIHWSIDADGLRL